MEKEKRPEDDKNTKSYEQQTQELAPWSYMSDHTHEEKRDLQITIRDPLSYWEKAFNDRLE